MSIFVLDLKNEKFWENIIGCELRVVNEGKPSKADCSNSSHGPSVFGDKDAPFLWCMEDTSHVRVS